MSISVTCSGCGTHYDIEDRLAGKKARCNQCGTVMQIPHPVPDPGEQDSDEFDPMPAAPRQAPPPPPRMATRSAATSVLERTHTPSLEYSRPARRRTINAPVEGATPALVGLFILVCLGVMGRGLYQYYQADPSIRAAMPPNMGATLTLAYGVNMVLFFAVVGPLVMLGVFVGSRIMNFPMADGSYIKACGVAAVPAVVLGILSFLPPNLTVLILGLVAILPLAFYVLKFAYGLDLPSGLVSYVFAGMFYLAGMFISGLIVAAVLAAGIVGAAVQKQPGGWAALPAPGGSNTLATPTVPTDPATATASSLRARLGSLIARSGASISQEKARAELSSLEKEVQAFSATYANHSALGELKQLVDESRKLIETLVSERPPEQLFTDPTPVVTWHVSDASAGGLGEEVSYRQYRIRPPSQAFLDLSTSESDPRGLIWRTPRRRGLACEISIVTQPRINPKQRLPWVISRSFQKQAADSQKLFYIDADGAQVTHGTVGELVFTRIAGKVEERPLAQRWVKYIAPVGTDWIVIDVRGPSEEGQLFDLLETSAWTVRPAKEGEPRSDPFSPQHIAARLEDSPDQAAAILRKHGSAAEAAVLPLLQHKEARVQAAAVNVLADIGSDKSVAAIRALARSADRGPREAARAAMKKLAPKEMDEVAEALLDLEDGNSFFERKAALEKLARLKPDDRRDTIAPLLEKMLLDRTQMNLLDPAAKALAVWAGPKTGQNLLPLLDQDGHPWTRKAAFTVLAQVKDPRTVFPVIRWLRLDRLNAIETLKAMGPVAEDEVIKLLSDRDARFREDAADILASIGTGKSLRALTPLSRDKRNQALSDAAQRAIDSIKERTPTTQPTTLPRLH